MSPMLLRLVVVVAGLAASLTGCHGGTVPSSAPGSSAPAHPSAASTATPGQPAPSQTPVPAEKNPPGDIPDNLAFVSYTNAAGHYGFVHPEGWAEVPRGTGVTFTDKLNAITATVAAAATPASVARARQQDVPRLRSAVPAFELRTVSAVRLPGGPAILIVFRRNSAPDPVTGRQYRDEVQEFILSRDRHEVRLDLSAPVGADNVDAYRRISDSLRLS